jgi:hypothetical protein
VVLVAASLDGGETSEVKLSPPLERGRVDWLTAARLQDDRVAHFLRRLSRSAPRAVSFCAEGSRFTGSAGRCARFRWQIIR